MVAGIPILHASNPYIYALPDLYDQHAAAIAHSSRPKAQRSASVASAPPNEAPQAKDRLPKVNPAKFRTRSIGGPFSSGIYFERPIDLSPPNDDEIIIATVRVTNSFRRASVEGCEELPSRPQPRSFLRRLSSRISAPPDPDRHTAIKMPRRDYKRWFARDRSGNYAGTEPEREWSQDQLDAAFGEYQDMPLRSIPGCNEFGEGETTSGITNEGVEHSGDNWDENWWEEKEGVEGMKVWDGWQETERSRPN